MTMASWHTDDESRVMIASIVLTILSVIFVVLRLFCRWSQRQHLSLSDICMVIALVCECIVEVLHVQTFASPPRVVTEREIARRLIISALVGTFSWLSLSAVRISILILFAEIFFLARDRLAIWIGVALCILFDLIFIPTILASCVPSASKTIPQQHHICHKVQEPISFTGSAISIIMNTYIIVLPMPTIFGMHMPRRKKILVSLNLSIGGFALVASLARLVIKIVARQGGVSSEEMRLAIWGSIEANCGIIAGSAVCLKMFFKKANRKKWRGNVQAAEGVMVERGEASGGGERVERRRISRRITPEDEGWGPERRRGRKGTRRRHGMQEGGRREDVKFIQVRDDTRGGMLDLSIP